jgi:glycosyltransferase involved in cell wall biosynthesis
MLFNFLRGKIEMKILFVGNTFPIPPRNGVELPLSQIMQNLSIKHKVFFALIYEGDKPDLSELKRVKFAPSWLNKVFMFQAIKRSKLKRICDEVRLRKPFYYRSEYNLNQIKSELKDQNIDLIWASPEGLGGFCEFFKQNVSSEVLISLGVNEPQFSIFAEAITMLFSGKTKWNLKCILRILRYPFVYFNERKYLKRFDIIHVQTELEKKQIHKLLGNTTKPYIIVAPNGIKEDLMKIDYRRPKEDKILFMTHLDGSRSQEYTWFLNSVWPKIIKEKPNTKLLIAGKIKKDSLYFCLQKVPGVRLLGFVNDLQYLYSSVTLCVVPIIHGTGLINRVLDALTAGVPVVGCPQPLKTIDGFIPNIHGISAIKAKDMAKEIIKLLSNNKNLYKFSKKGKEIAANWPTWETNTKKIEKVILKRMQNY